MRMAADFHEFLINYTLSPDDANYDFYTMNVEDTDQPIYHYRNVADNIRSNELQTLSVDFSHMSNYKF